MRPREQAKLSRRRRLRFQDLIGSRVQRILLVSSLYESFILAEDGQLSDAILNEFAALNLRSSPDLTRVSTGAEALALARERNRFDLIITSLHIGDMNALELARVVKEAGLDIPVVLLAYNNRELGEFRNRHDMSPLDRVFLWQGDVRILVAIIKYTEDRLNVAFDTGVAGVPAIIVVEDNVRFYSSFLPMIYTELVKHTQNLISEGLNLHQKLMRLRARPKILLCDTYEEAWSYFSTYQEHVLGVISDIEFAREGRLERMAGVELARGVRRLRPDLPIILQSSFPENEALARSVGAAFLLKGSPTLLQQLGEFIVTNFGFGDFVFQMPDGHPVDRAGDLKTLVEKLHSVPVECIAYHGERNHFSNWLKARGEFALAEKLRPRKVSEFDTLEDLRQKLIDSIGDYRLARDRVVVADFNRERLEEASSVARIGDGSLGGKARGLAFVNRLLGEYQAADQFPTIDIAVPPSVVLGTDIFDEFLERNSLRDFAIRSTSDLETENRFLGGSFPEALLQDLQSFLEAAPYPLAVRSSGLLEDSPIQPLAGIYQTYMLPNNNPDPQTRLVELLAAVKRVYASTFSQQAKGFLPMTPFRLEEEKMAVIIQKVVGAAHDGNFYPDFAGVARSYNYYPAPPNQAEDGIVAVALGLGKTVVEGGVCLHFCPKNPRHVLSFSSVDEAVKTSQREFFALGLDHGPGRGVNEAGLRRLGLSVAEEDGVLARLGSTYSPDNYVVYDGISRPGVRLVSFAPILKHGLFPLADLLALLLEIGSEGTSGPVEIEFAGNLSVPSGARPEFGFLQMRPLALAGQLDRLDIGDEDDANLICRSSSVLGNGRITGLRDVVVVDSRTFDRLKSHEVAQAVAMFNAELRDEGTPYVLIGVGRWGTADPHLGIPVTWNQISAAQVIIEAGFRDLKVAPSQGTHFFQNITSCNVGYFTVNPDRDEGFIDWDWLAAVPAVKQTDFVRRLHFDEPLTVKISGKTGEGIVLKPGSGSGK